MRYGFCTGFATNPRFTIDSSLEAAVSSWGFDYMEYPLMSLAALPEEDFAALRRRVADTHLACDSMCNLFPASVPVVGEAASEAQIRTYLDIAFERAAALGSKKIIFGSAGARKRNGLPLEKANQQFLTCLHLLEEYCSRYQVVVLLEAIRRGEADYINTLAEGAELVYRAREEGCTHIGLMADLFHMESNGEPLSDLERYLPLIQHIHLCEMDRKLPKEQFSPYLQKAIEILRVKAYHETVSYESVMPENKAEGTKAAELLKAGFSNFKIE